MSTSHGKLEIKPYSKKELAAIYGITPRSFSTWLKPFSNLIGRKIGKYYNIHQVKMIVDKLGFPFTMED
jgi:transposase